MSLLQRLFIFIVLLYLSTWRGGGGKFIVIILVLLQNLCLFVRSVLHQRRKANIARATLSANEVFESSKTIRLKKMKDEQRTRCSPQARDCWGHTARLGT